MLEMELLDEVGWSRATRFNLKSGGTIVVRVHVLGRISCDSGTLQSKVFSRRYLL